jgi:hypothetical protein
MKVYQILSVLVAGVTLAGCSGLYKDLSRQEKYLLGGGALGATVLSIATVGAPGATTAVLGGAALGVGAGYALEYVTRPIPPAPPGSLPVQSAGRIDGEARLRELMRLRDSQLISVQEYESRRRVILESL